MVKNYWFTTKNYGWGWKPATWQAWVVIAFYIVALWYIGTYRPFPAQLIEFGLLMALFVVIMYKTGEKPRWRWGN